MGDFLNRLLEIVDEVADGKPTVFAKNADIPPSTFQYYVKGRMPHGDHLTRICEHYSVNINWLLTGKGEKYIKDTECESGTYKAGYSLDENPEIAGLLDEVKEVLKSGTGYSEILIANIRLFHHAMKTEKRLNGFEKRLGKIEKDKSRKEKPPRIRKGDNEAERDTILKNRAACFC